MSSAISSPTANFHVPSNTQVLKNSNSSSFSIICLKSTNNFGRKTVGLLVPKKLVLAKQGFRCNCSSTPGGPAPGENESKQVLDAFFLGKAFAEALNERIESTVGEFLSTVGRLQAEQQKQVQEFQDEVLERAKKAKEKAAREAMEAQALVPESAASNISPATANKTGNASVTVSTTIDEPTDSIEQGTNNGNTDPLLGISIDD
uniref:uncharacterized protein At4g13200, chloroplastic n=1 Tax=Erigeron canadensis TaxID=72917 RepID=UPI001CB93A67|nr:uncharacterized protein At4g13200, chloroplastic [Erigeron canadensis]